MSLETFWKRTIDMRTGPPCTGINRSFSYCELMPCTHTQLHSLGNWCLSHDRLLPKITRKIHQLQRDKQRQWAGLHSRSNRPLQQLFSYFDRELSPVTFTSKLHLYNVKVNQHARGQRSLSSKLIVQIHRHTHTPDWSALPGPLKWSVL